MTVRDLTGAVVAVVGASGGLGAPLARALAGRGADVILAGPHLDRLESVGLPGAAVVRLDVRDARAGDLIVAAAMDRAGRLDGVVNIAGVVAFGLLEETEDVTVEELFLTNVVGPLWLVRRVIPLLRASRGFIVNVSAGVAEQPLANMAVYSATKAALSAADRALARELRRDGIHVCDARPPHTETGLATRPIAGHAPRMPIGLEPGAVADRIVRAIELGEPDLPAAAFAAEPAPDAAG